MAERRRTVSPKVRQALYAVSGGLCYHPGCTERVIAIKDSIPVLVGQIAHIVGAVSSGPRGDAEVDDRDGFDNLIVLCGRHHKLVDDSGTRGLYPPELLRSWKAKREAAYRESEPCADDGASGPNLWPTGGSSLLHATTDAEQVLAMELLALIDQAHDREAWDQFEQQNPALVKRARQSWDLIPLPIWSYLRRTGVELLKAALQGNQSEILSQLTSQRMGFLRELHYVRQGTGGHILTDIGMFTAAAAVTD